MKLSELGEIVDIPALEDKDWGDFRVCDIATVNSGRDIYAQERVPGDTPYVTSGTKDNGIGYFVGNDNDSLASNAISVARNGAVGEAFYHPYKALYGNDCRRVNLIYTHSQFVQLFVALCISKQKSAFSYSRKLGTERLKRLHIMLPVNDSDEPDYEYMEQYSRNMMIRKYRQYIAYLEREMNEIERERANGPLIALEDKEWKPISLSRIFVNHHGKRLTKNKRIAGQVPLLTAGESNNGIADFVSNSNMPIHSHFVSIDMFGNAFFHPYQATGDDNIYFFENEKLSECAKAFICVSVEKQACKFSYGKQFRQYSADNSHIMLPVTDSGEPDYEYMEQYGRKMMADKYCQYLAYLRG